MKKTMMIGSAAVLAMLSGQAMAATAPVANAASSLSVSKSVRAGTVSTTKSKLAGNGAIIVGVLATAAIVGGVIAISKDDDADSN